MTLTTPGGEALEVEMGPRVDDDAAVRATFRMSRSSWEEVLRLGLLHVDAARATTPLDRVPAEGDVEVDVELDPDAGSEQDAQSWWALHATAEVDLPPELAGIGSLREGVSFSVPPWRESELGSAWRDTSALLDDDARRG